MATFNFRCSDEEKICWEEAATAKGWKIAAWVKGALNDRAMMELMLTVDKKLSSVPRESVLDVRGNEVVIERCESEPKVGYVKPGREHWCTRCRRIGIQTKACTICKVLEKGVSPWEG